VPLVEWPVHVRVRPAAAFVIRRAVHEDRERALPARAVHVGEQPDAVACVQREIFDDLYVVWAGLDHLITSVRMLFGPD
jgi:hypothetical protein